MAFSKKEVFSKEKNSIQKSNNMKQSGLFWIQLLAGIILLFLIFHVLILTQVIPYEITWGGRLKSVQEMWVFESISIIMNGLLLFLLSQKSGLFQSILSEKIVHFGLWIYVGIFILNTVGNLAAATLLEKSFSLVTFFMAWILLKIIRMTPQQYL